MTCHFPSSSFSISPSFWISSTISGSLVVEVVQVAQDLVAVLEHVLGELVEDLVGRLGQELLRAVPLGIFEQRHAAIRSVHGP